MSGNSRGNPALGDIVRSVLVLGLAVVALYGVGQFFTRTPQYPTSEVDYREAAKGAAAQTGFTPLVPKVLPEDWRATSARFDGNTWELGVLTADEEFVGLKQLRDSQEAAIARWAEGSKADQDVTIGGQSWQRRTGPGSDSTYVRSDGDVAVLVTGTGSRTQIETYLTSLEPFAASD